MTDYKMPDEIWVKDQILTEQQEYVAASSPERVEYMLCGRPSVKYHSDSRMKAVLEAAEGMEKVLSLLPVAETETWRDLVTLTKAQQALTEWKKIKTFCGK